jgi:hypothetical protein
LKNDDFIGKFAKAKKIFRLSMESIFFKNVNIVKSSKNKKLPHIHWSIQFPWGET